MTRAAMTGAAMSGAAQLRRYGSRPDWLLTAAALVIMLLTSVAGGSLAVAGRLGRGRGRGCRGCR